jgi:ferredoxin-thioredoxin reductase catalytic subunit
VSFVLSLSLCHGVDNDPMPASCWICLRLRLRRLVACVHVWRCRSIPTYLPTSLPTYRPTYFDPGQRRRTNEAGLDWLARRLIQLELDRVIGLWSCPARTVRGGQDQDQDAQPCLSLCSYTDMHACKCKCKCKCTCLFVGREVKSHTR